MSQSPFKTDSFKRLQAEWYEKLKKDGFEEIESLGSPHEYLKKWHCHYFQVRHTPEEFLETLDYFLTASHASSTISCEVERKIWTMHSDGMSYREIARRLKHEGLSASKDTVGTIVLRIQSELIAG